MNVRFSILLAGLIVAACTASSGQVVKTFELAEPADAPFSRVLVVGAHKDRSTRRLFEETMVGALRDNKIDALSSIENMPSGEKLTAGTVAATAQRVRVDAVLVSRLQDVKWSAEARQGRTTTEARRKEDGNMLDFFRYDYVDYEEPMQARAVRTVIVTSDLYRVSDRAKIWSVESTAVEKESAMDVIQSVAASTVGQLRRDGLVR